MIRLELRALRKKITEVKGHFYHITSCQGYIILTWLTIVDVDVEPDHLAKLVFVRFLHCKVNLSLHIPLLDFRKEVSMYSPCLRREKLCYPSFNMEYLHKLLGILHRIYVFSLLLINLFNHYIKDLRRFMLWAIIQYYFIFLL